MARVIACVPSMGTLENGMREMDAVEQMLGKQVEDLTDTELVVYVKTSMKEINGLDLPVQGQRERAIMAGLKRTYGRDAGKIIKWVFHHHHGRRDGKPITYSMFSKNMKWWTDIMYLELQEAAQRQAANAEAAQGFFKSSDL